MCLFVIWMVPNDLQTTDASEAINWTLTPSIANVTIVLISNITELILPFSSNLIYFLISSLVLAISWRISHRLMGNRRPLAYNGCNRDSMNGTIPLVFKTENGKPFTVTSSTASCVIDFHLNQFFSTHLVWEQVSVNGWMSLW